MGPGIVHCMGVSALVLVVGQLAVAQPELVVLPPSTEGAKASDGLAAWKVITGQLERAKGRLGVSTKVQKTQHDFLVGPAREQARDCAMKVGCLADVGSTLGADILVAGRIEKTQIVLTAIDIAERSRVGEVRSRKNLAKRGLKRRARDVAQRLRRLLKTAKKKAPPAVAEAPPPSDTPPTAGGPPPTDAASDGAMGAKLDDPPPPPAGSALALGSVTIPADQLRGVSQVTIDGEVVAFAGSGAMTWTGAPGEHTLVAQRIDGQSVTRSVRVNPNDATQVTLDFPAVAPAPATSATTRVEPATPVTSKWWFWTSIGVAVLAGTGTAVLLIGGDKGGPALPPVNGSITGSY
jgi:hypothetical protein